mmetsp:Transcript_12748/g.30994  ORF Transcript_12748/g.30994 Transcript_12748/m.30994 type:complete len:98 (+) Transcript_12748:1649-1942(+)
MSEKGKTRADRFYKECWNKRIRVSDDGGRSVVVYRVCDQTAEVVRTLTKSWRIEDVKYLVDLDVYEENQGALPARLEDKQLPAMEPQEAGGAANEVE